MWFQFIKKGEKQILKNYLSISLLPIAGKILERLNSSEHLSDVLLTNAKLFAEDTSLFSVVRNNTPATHFNNDLRKISNWAFQWKMSFNPDPNKQAQEVIFSRKHQKNKSSLYLLQ